MGTQFGNIYNELTITICFKNITKEHLNYTINELDI